MNSKLIKISFGIVACAFPTNFLEIPVNGSRLSSRPVPSNDDVVSFNASRNFRQWLERAKMRNDWLPSGKSPYLTLSFSFQINISVKISVGLLRNLCGNLVEKFASDQSGGSSDG